MSAKLTGRESLSRKVGPGVVLALAILILVASAGPSEHAKLVVRTTSNLGAGYNGVSCTGAGWNNSHLSVGIGSCQAAFGGQYEVNNSAIPNETNGYNFSFFVDWVGEFTPSGQLVRLASPLAPVSGRANSTVRGDEVNLSMSQVLNVTNASGEWTPNDTWAGRGPQWNVSNETIGTTVFGMGVQLNVSQFATANSTVNASSSVKFDVGLSGWPWAAQTDRLGFVLDSLGAWGSYFTFNATSSTLADNWNTTNRTFISVVFGGDARVTYPSGPGAVANVTEQAGLFAAGIPNREAVVLVAFGNVSGNYSQVAYDPWIVFSLIPTTLPSHPPGPSSSWDWPAVLVAATAVLLIGGITGQVVRQVRLRRQGEELVRGMRVAIGEEPGSTGRAR